MSLIANEIKELRQMSKLLAAGKITSTYVQSQMKIFKEVRTRYEFVLKALIASNKPHVIEGRMHGFNIISKGEHLQSPAEIELEMIMCPEKNDKAITREECLSYSGDVANHENCRSCEHFAITRKLLLSKEV